MSEEERSERKLAEGKAPEEDDLDLALHAVRGNAERVVLAADGVALSWAPVGAAADAGSAASSTTTPSPSPQHLPALLAVAGSRRVYELCMSAAEHKSAAVHRGALAAIAAAMREHGASTGADGSGASSSPSPSPSWSAHLVNIWGARAVRTLAFKNEAGRRAAGEAVAPLGAALAHGVGELASHVDGAPAAVADVYMALTLVEEALTALAALASGAGADENVTLAKQAGVDGVLASAAVLLPRLVWPPAGGSAQSAGVEGAAAVAARAAARVAPTLTPAESVKRLMFLQALLQ